MKRLTKLALTAAVALLGTTTLFAAPATMTVDVANPGHQISPTLWGIFFEDINCSADGGLYAELVRNRNFENTDKPEFWSGLDEGALSSKIELNTAEPVSAKNPRSLKVVVSGQGQGRGGVINEGFWGIALKKGESYDLSLLARAADGFQGPLTLTLESEKGEVYSTATIKSLASSWKEHKAAFKAKATDPKARLVISTTRPGTFYLDMVSLFPRKTWKNHGLRPDLAEMLAGLKPGFVRFPGGCWVEGDTMKLAYRWKETIGPVSERRTQYNIWQYYATHGIGYHEYLQLCEDLGAAPLFVINCGMSHREVVPMDKMGEFVQDALDAIEYANGPVSSTWGSVRAKNGHPKPFNLQYLEIGNENGGAAYQERYSLFYDAIKAKYPEIKLIANEWGGRPSNRPIEIIDEHYYSTPEFFIRNAGKYDNYKRDGYKVYVGEYAVTQNGGKGNLRAAVGEAAFMTGMERNSDVVVMSSYAPLFANIHYKKWNPDLICYDSARAYGLPGYYVQKLFSQNRGDRVLPLAIDAAESAPAAKSGAVGVGTWLTRAEFKDMKVTRGNETLFQADLSQGTKAWRLHGGDWSVQDGALRQSANTENIRAFAGDKTWRNYTYTLKARKIGGAEGFLVPFLVQDEGAKCWWNIGGWGNSRHAIEMEGAILSEAQGKVEDGRWYDIKIEAGDAAVKCYLDGKLIHDVKIPTTYPLYAAASTEGKEVILKVVNVTPEPCPTQINLKGATISGKATLTILKSDSPEDENSVEQPAKVVPLKETISCSGSAINYDFPGNSVSVIRVRTK